jgi:hypothetical protein
VHAEVQLDIRDLDGEPICLALTLRAQRHGDGRIAVDPPGDVQRRLAVPDEHEETGACHVDNVTGGTGMIGA